MLKRFIQKSNRASGPLTVADWGIKAWTWLASLTGVSTVIGWLSTTWDWYWTTFNWAGAGIAFLVAWLVLGITIFLVGQGMAAWRRAAVGSAPADLQPNATASSASKDQNDALGETVASLADIFEQRVIALHEELQSVRNALATVQDSMKPKPGGLLGEQNPPGGSRLDQIQAGLQKLLDRVSDIEDLLKPPGNTILGNLGVRPGERLDNLEKKFDDGMRILTQAVRSNEEQTRNSYSILVTALRARDALDLLREADKIVTNLGPRLIEAKSIDYPNGQVWAADHNLWGYRLDSIDGLFGQWMETHRPFHDVRRHDYEHESRAAPEHIVADEPQNAVRYKQVCISHGRYEQARAGIFNFFAMKAGELPG